ncbi:MATH domain and coiled-coil domain-containing protein At2g42465-like [Eutrema salsugineum]|uniref:MATH domain and coiled-coil domain-containing protein At2g42465-like n=1 Tax=Eutrema salsugineum TaxID=72664 RepID=UPI000CED4578|nr:MATH domain and coiled-coil domain-containing protein At2g42465-like [Eutrema salsugineum]
MALCAAANQATWLKRLLMDLGITTQVGVPIYSDSQSAIAIGRNPVQHRRTKHIQIKYHVVRDYEKSGEIQLMYRKGEDQVADVFTKALGGQSFDKLHNKLGVVTGSEILDVQGFQDLHSQEHLVNCIFAEYLDSAVNFKPKNRLVRKTYMNMLICLVETLNKPPHSLSATALSIARDELIDLTNAGFKLDGLKENLDEVSLARKKENADCFRFKHQGSHN